MQISSIKRPFKYQGPISTAKHMQGNKHSLGTTSRFLFADSLAIAAKSSAEKYCMLSSKTPLGINDIQGPQAQDVAIKRHNAKRNHVNRSKFNRAQETDTCQKG